MALVLFDPGTIVALQHLSPLLTDLLAAGKDLDSLPVYLVVLVLFYLGFSPKHGIRLAVVFGIAGGADEALKLFFHLPRPYWVSSAVKAYYSLPSFGFPSGGAMCSTVLYGYIAAVVRRFWVVVACIVLAALTMLARIFAGVHFVTDVVGGFLLGALFLVLAFTVSPRIEAFGARLRPPARILGILLLSALPLIIALPAYCSLAGWQVPADWVATALAQTGATISPVQIPGAWEASGFVLGGLLGYEYLRSLGGWEPPERILPRIAVALSGVVSTLLLFMLAIAVLTLPAIPQAAALFVSAVLTGLWFTACVPLAARRWIHR